MTSRRRIINFVFRVLGVLSALLFTALILLIAHANPMEAFSNIFKGAFSTSIKIADSFVAWVPLILTTCGLVITFTAGLWNIGIEGQITLGAIATTWALRLLQDSGLPPVLIIAAGILRGNYRRNHLGAAGGYPQVLWRCQRDLCRPWIEFHCYRADIMADIWALEACGSGFNERYRAF